MTSNAKTEWPPGGERRVHGRAWPDPGEFTAAPGRIPGLPVTKQWWQQGPRRPETVLWPGRNPVRGRAV